MRRLAMIALIAVGTAAGVLYWLHDGDLEGAVAPVLPQWDAARLAELAGIKDPPGEPAPPPTADGAARPREVSEGAEDDRP
jgi:hypothetical protein